MKNLILFIALLIGLSLQAQTFTEQGRGHFNVNNGVKTNLIINVEGTNFDIYETSSGSHYIKSLSSKGNHYPVWIFEKTGLLYKNYPVYVTKNGKYCYYKLSKIGYPYTVWLKKE